MREFWDYSGERAIKTVAQTALAVIAAQGVGNIVGIHLGLFNLDWINLISVSGLAGLMSILTSVITFTRS